jgi:putative phosphoribosyl transferase
MMFDDRSQAGRVLADRLDAYVDRDDAIVLALPRGGVPVAFEIARALAAPLDVYPVRKLGVPGQPELAMGAIAADGTRVVNQAVVEELGISQSAIDAAAAAEQQRLEQAERDYRDRLPWPKLGGRVVIVVDDGLATGSTMRAAVAAIRRHEPSRIVVAVPAGAEQACQELQRHADQVVCASTPEPFLAVGQAYRHFEQVGDEEVRALLRTARAAGSPGEAPPTPDPTGVGQGTRVGTAGTGVTTVPADTGDLAGTPEEAAARRAHVQAQRGRGERGRHPR